MLKQIDVYHNAQAILVCSTELKIYHDWICPWLREDFFLDTLRPWQNGQLFTENSFKYILLNENISISINISLNFVP